jgi:hypothetical protein
MKAKPIILAIVTLVIGFVIGMLTSAQIRLNRTKPVRFYLSREQFRDGFYKTIQANDEQKAELEEVLNKYELLNNDLLTEYRKGFDQNVKEMQKELESILTREQQDILKEIDDRRQEIFREARRNFSRDSANSKNFDRRDRRGRPPPPPGGRRPFNGAEAEGDDTSFRNRRPVPPQYTPDHTTGSDSVR